MTTIRSPQFRVRATTSPRCAPRRREIAQRACAAALASLPSAQRDAFLLHQEGGLALAEIAALTGVGIETVKSRIRYAQTRLRAELEDLR